MSVIGNRVFSGEIPRTEEHLLPQGNAQRAVDCDFANGSIKPLRGGFLLRSMANNPVRGIFTEDGISFYTWSSEAQAYSSPVIDDTFNRMYFLLPSQGTFMAATKLGMAFNGPSPSAGNQWKVGVPRPTVAPALAIGTRTTIPGYDGSTGKAITMKADVWWEDATGVEFSRVTNVPLAETLALQQFKFSRPAEPTGGEEGATYKLCVRFAAVETTSGTEVFSVTLRGETSTRISAFPGGIEVYLNQLTETPEATVTLKWGVVETRAYVYTYTNTWKEEGAPSPAETISVTYIQDVILQATPPDFSGYRPMEEMKVYRTFGSNSTYIEIDYASTGANMAKDSSWTPKTGGQALESTNWTPPPTGLQGSELMPNGWFAAFKGNTLYMSEPYRPHAWPYNMTFAKSIRGIRAGQQSLVVITADGVYIVAGNHPSAAQQVKLSTPQPGIVQRGMANIDGAVAYTSNDGFVLVDGTSASPELSQAFFDRQTWRDRYGQHLSSMALAYHDGAMVAASSVNEDSFIIRMDDGTKSFTRMSERFDAMFLLPVNDALYYSQGNVVYQFQGGSRGSFEWWSPDYIFPRHDAMGAGYIRCDGTVNLEVFGDGQLLATKTNLTTGHFRLSGQIPRCLRWSFKLYGTGTVYECFLGRSMMELQNV